MSEPALPPVPWRAHWPVAVLAAIAGLIALWARFKLFPAYSWNRDEPVYLWHVDLLRQGHLDAPDGGHPGLFQPWLSARGDGTFFTQYTLGWPLVLLVADLLTGSPTAALPVGAALAVVGTYALAFELLRSRRVATVAGALMVASPLLAVQGGVYLSYLFTLGLGLLFGVLLLSGVRQASRARLIGAGALLGWIFLTRPYDAVLWGAAFAGYLLITQREQWRHLITRFLWCGVTAVPLLLAGLAYNRAMTGGWVEFPITAADPLDTFGFGTKRLMPGFETTEYGPGSALKATAKNGFVLPWFLAGSYLTVAVAAAGVWIHRRSSATLALLLLAAVFPLGYFVFWGTHLSSLASRISGPIYFVPLYATVCTLAAMALVRWWSQRPRITGALAVVLAVVTIPLAQSRFEVNQAISENQRSWRESVEDIDEPALVLVADTGRYLLYTNPFSANRRDLDGPIVYAAAGSSEVLDLIEEHPDRAVYRQEASISSPELGPREDPYDFDVELTPVTVIEGQALTLEVTVSPPSDARFAAVDVSTGADSQRSVVELVGGGASRPLLDVVLAPEAQTAGAALALDEAGAVTVTVGYGTTEAAALAAPVVRQTVRYRSTAGAVHAVLPPEQETYLAVADRFEWRHSPRSGELMITVEPTAP